MNSKLKELLSKDYLTDVYGKIIYFVMVDGDLNSKLEAEKAIRQAVGEEMLELISTNQKGQFEADGGHIAWYLDDLQKVIKQWAAHQGDI